MTCKANVILPAWELRGGRRRGRNYIDAEDLVSFLYKAAGEKGQDAGAAMAFRDLADVLREEFVRA